MASQSGRSLGKGRVIGARGAAAAPSSSNTLSPAAAAAINGNGSGGTVLSPSASSLSLNSQHSTSRSSNDETDITSAVALSGRSAVRAGASAAGAAAGGARMVCPICGEDMVTLLQLNRHLDDAHKELAEEEEDEVKTWFKTQMIKAKKFQPLAVLNQKFKGLDVFESNTDIRPPAPTTATNASTEIPPSQRPAASVVDPDDVVSKDHWQRYTSDGTCSDPLCPKRLSPSNGSINCRHCGRLFCEEHSMYQMKLSRSAQWEPVRGFWCRVCETCYKSRDGYNDHRGIERDHMQDFAAVRRKAVDKAYLDVSRLEKRLTKLTQVLTDPRIEEDQGTFGYLRKVSGTKSQQRQLEESVVEWEDDATVERCPFCQQQFTTYSFRRHHCRLCGRVVCADEATACSAVVALDVAPQQQLDETEKSQPVAVEIRMCGDCRSTVFGRADFGRELAQPTADQRTFSNLKQFEQGIRAMLPRFQRLLAALQDPERPPSPAQLAEAAKVRRRLMDSFTQYDVAARRMRDMPTSSSTQARLQKKVYVQASQFVHVHMLPLKSLPKMLKHASPHGRTASENSQHARGPVAAARRQEVGEDEVSTSSRLSSLETEEKAAREQLMVLEEQRFMVGQMVDEARRRRKFDEVQSLGRNLEDLGRECDRLQSVLEGLRRDVEGVYTGFAPP